MSIGELRHTKKKKNRKTQKSEDVGGDGNHRLGECSRLDAIGLQAQNSNVSCILCKKTEKTKVTTVRAMLKHVYRCERPILSRRNYSTSVSTFNKEIVYQILSWL